MAEFRFEKLQWERFFDKIKFSLKNPSKLLEVGAATIGFKDIIDHFKKEEGSDGKWRKRKSSTQNRYEKISSGQWKNPKGTTKRQFNPANKLLQMTGTLRKSINRKNQKRINSNSILLFSPVIYSGIHDRGDISKKIPKREFMYLGKDAEDKFLNFLLSRITGEK